MLVPPSISRRDQKGLPFLSAATPSLRAAEIVIKGRRNCKAAFSWLLRLAEDLLPRRRVPATRKAFKVALKDHESRFAKRVAKEHVFVASGGGNGVSSLATPINRLRDDNRADRSPSQDPSPVFSLQLLDQDLF
jgi:hypothetical protein